MDPRWLLPLLAIVFAVLALVRRVRSGHWHGAARTWVLIAIIFGAVSLWLHWLA